LLEDPFFSVRDVLMDVSQPAYRDWRIRYLMYKLEDQGIEPGEPACVIVAYKPGFHTFHDEKRLGPGYRGCSTKGTHTWRGPAQICQDRFALGGPLNPTPYGPGEFEAGVNAFLREMMVALAAHGYPELQVITTENPAYRKAWSILEPDLRANPDLGMLGPRIEPPL
jgi:hypothetical protein